MEVLDPNVNVSDLLVWISLLLYPAQVCGFATHWFQLSLCIAAAPSCAVVVHGSPKIHRPYPVVSCAVSSCSVRGEELRIGPVLMVLSADVI